MLRDIPNLKDHDLDESVVKYNDLDGFFGSFVEDEQFEEALKTQRQIDEELWK